MPVIGSISTFDPSVDRFDTYNELFNHFCVSNDITGERKKSAFLTCIGAVAYRQVKDLIIPKKVEDSSYEEIVNILSEHYKPSCIEIAERYKFFKRTQASGESVMEFLAELKKIVSGGKRLPDVCPSPVSVQPPVKASFYIGKREMRAAPLPHSRLQGCPRAGTRTHPGSGRI